MAPEPDLGESEDPCALVRGDVAAVRTTVGHLTDLAAGFGATAEGLRAIEVGAWTGAAADAFRARFAQAPAEWSRAAGAFRSAAQAWDWFCSVLTAAQTQAGTAVARFRAGNAAAERAHASYTAAVDLYLARLAVGQNPGPAPTLDDTGGVEIAAARALLADARSRRDAAGDGAARAVAAAAAVSPDPPTGVELRAAEVADRIGASGIELAHVAEGFGEGVEGLVRFARMANPADPYNLVHPGRYVENASAALSGAVDTLAHPLSVVTNTVGAGWGSDPARAFGHLLPSVLAVGAGGGSALGGGRAAMVRSAVGAAGEAVGAVQAGAGRSVLGAAGDVVGEGGRGRPPLLTDPRPTARPFQPAPPAAHPAGTPTTGRSPTTVAGDGPAPRAAEGGGAVTAPLGGGQARVAEGPAPPGAVVAADRAAAERLDRVGRGLRRDLNGLMPHDAAPSAPPPPPRAAAVAEVVRVRRSTGDPAATEPGARALNPLRRDGHHDPERARRSRLTRADKDFASPTNRRGARKSHLDERGDLVPANPGGATSVVEHVVGRRSPVKGDSPYSSFTSPGARAEVEFGGQVIEVDIVRLQADIDAGLVPGVEILPPHCVQAAIQADADRIAGCPVDLYVRKGHAAEAARSYGLGAEATAALRQRMIDMANAQRHHEWMIRGVVPGRYIVGPHPGGRHG